MERVQIHPPFARCLQIPPGCSKSDAPRAGGARARGSSQTAYSGSSYQSWIIIDYPRNQDRAEEGRAVGKCRVMGKGCMKRGQIEMVFRTHGGKRSGAGRKPKGKRPG